MATLTTLYNSLPSVVEADRKFLCRDQIFSKLSSLLAAYGNKFGVCLVHRHCELEDGEMMVATGNITQPERNVECYPERWLATGEPYEFNRNPTRSPPRELFEEFQKIVDAVDVLGLFYIQDEQRLAGVSVERTEGRKNIVEIVLPVRSHTSISSPNAISTGWLPGYSTMQLCCQCIIVDGIHVSGY
jgi:hypothetical protein